MITLIGTYTYQRVLAERSGDGKASPVSFYKGHPFFVGITILLTIVGLNIALGFRRGSSIRRSAAMAYGSIGGDYLAYTLFLVHRSRLFYKKPSAHDYPAILNDFFDGFPKITTFRTPDNKEALGIECEGDNICPFQDLLQWAYSRENDPAGWVRYRNTQDMLSGSDTALQYYTGSGYTVMNNLLRGVSRDKDVVMVRRTLRTIFCASAQLWCHRPLFKGTTYRGANINNDYTDKFITEQYKEGQIVIEQGFLSTTTNSNRSAYSVRFTVQGVSGRDVKRISNYADENEVLFMPFTKFLVLKNDRNREITLKEIEN